MDRVLVTGASGFIAKYCIAELLKAGYHVRGTVRSLSRRDEIHRALVQAGVDTPQLELVEADLNADAGWDEAVADCRYVLHVASPFPSREPRNSDELVVPARDGVLRVLKAASSAGVERLVQTSSVVAILYCGKPDEILRSEEDWSDTSNPALSAYSRSKTLAERAAWQEIAQLAPEQKIEFCTVNPGVVLGPALDRDLSTSHVLIRMLGRGSYPALPKMALPIVDVRDVAAQHLLAMTLPSANGQRWLSCNGSLSIRRMAELVADALPDLARKVPKIELPSSMVRLAGHFDSRLKAIRADLGRSHLCDNRNAEEQLGMEFRSAEDAVKSAAQSLRQLGII